MQPTLSARSGNIQKLAWIPIAIFILMVPWLWSMESRGTFVSHGLALGINFFGRTLIALFIVYLAGRSFYLSGRLELLLMGCGVGIWGVGATITILLGMISPSMGMMTASLAVFTAGACHMTGAVTLNRSKTVRSTLKWEVLAYSAMVFVLGVITLAEVTGMLPTFFVEGSGGTQMRHAILGSAIAMFIISAILLRAENRPSQSSFSQWYSYALLMIAAGQLGAMLETSRYTWLGWLVRVSQAVGGVYMLIAVIASARETGGWGISLREALRESEERFRLFMDNSPSIAWIKDETGRNMYTNKTFQNRFNLPVSKTQGKKDGDLWPEEIASRYRKTDKEAISAGRPIEYTEQYRNPDGTFGDWIVIKFPLRDSSGTQMVAGIGIEITARKRAEEELRVLNQTLEVRVNERTRELKESVRQLQELAQQLTQAEEQERGRLAEVLHDDLQQLLVATKIYLNRLGMGLRDDRRARELINDTENLLDAAILRTRNLSHELSPPFFAQQDLVASMKWLCEQMKIKYDLAVRFSGAGEIETDDTLKVFLFRAAQEMLFNTVKHANVHEASVELLRAGDRLELIVSDDGSGFDPGQIGPHGRMRSGFGLFSIQERISVMGGKMEIESAPGKGSRFKLTVPLSMGCDVKSPSETGAGNLDDGAESGRVAEEMQGLDREAKSFKI